ncbi:hypothetical protein BD289DRAFT_484223 [Coniella lustricola]|uniref:WSC domain-containing protein n=1 Tax=Coniella lustricola TaxID=2025994 RepID=A0A2T3A2N2_9PEZI|nr:hypothetical protein BD289DRAFT_484223 [Coniella lustricola]
MSAPQPSTVGNFSFQGCWPDDFAKPMLKASMNLTTIDLDACAAACNNHNAFGAEAGNECYCGTEEISRPIPAPSTPDCTLACTDNEMQVCGGVEYISMYIRSSDDEGIPREPTTGLGFSISTHLWASTMTSDALSSLPSFAISPSSGFATSCSSTVFVSSSASTFHQPALSTATAATTRTVVAAEGSSQFWTGGKIAGLAVGVVLAVITSVLFAWMVFHNLAKRRRQAEDDAMPWDTNVPTTRAWLSQFERGAGRWSAGPQ